MADKNELTLQGLLKKCCPERFTMSGEKGKKLDCFVVYCSVAEQDIILKESKDSKFIGLALDPKLKRHTLPIELNFKEVKDSIVVIQHYWHGNTISFDSINDYRFHKITKLIYLKTQLINLWDNTKLFFYRRRLLVAPERMALLKTILDMSMKNHMGQVPKGEIERKLLGERWASHPKGLEEYKKLRLLYDSLVESNDIIGGNDSYQPTGRALSTLQNYELEDMRYKSQVRLQWWLVLATIVLAASALIEVGLIDWILEIIKEHSLSKVSS